MFRDAVNQSIESRIFIAGLSVMSLAILMGWFISPLPQQALAKALFMLAGLAASWFLFLSSARWISPILKTLYGLAVAIAGYFLLANNWSNFQADFSLLKWAGIILDKLTPNNLLPVLQPNKAAGLLVMLFPFTCLFVWDRLQSSTSWAKVFFVTGSAIIFFSIVLTSSRAAWFSLILGSFAAWMMGNLPRRWKIRASAAFFSLILLLVCFVLASALTGSTFLSEIFDKFPGERTAESRFELAASGLYLIGDYPITGSGLQSFAAVYSQYILAIPHFKFAYSHNLYLDLYLELGFLGLISWVAVYTSAVSVLGRTESSAEMDTFSKLLQLSTLASIFTILLHGLLDDPLISGTISPFFFIVPALVFTVQNHPYPEKTANPGWRIYSNKVLHKTILIICVLLLVIVLTPQTLSALYSNLGAIQMAKVELADFPSDEWQTEDLLPALQAAGSSFRHALQQDPNNRTANHRLGLIAMLAKDYLSAEKYLGLAHDVSPAHRGITKNLGYTYLWLDDFPTARQLLSNLPEIPQELQAYQTWWKAQGYPDLASTAARFIDYSN